MLRLQSRLVAQGGPGRDLPGLGYRGFLYRDSTGPVRAYRGEVTASARVLEDPQRSVERFLLSTMPLEFADLRDRVASELREGV